MMHGRDNQKSALRRYLLGSTPDGERDRLEQALLADENLYEELLATEEELIDQCVWGQLTEPEQASFLQYLGALPDHEQRLKFARALRAHGLNSRGEAPVASYGAQGKPGVTFRYGLRGPAYWLAAAVIVLALVGVWYFTTATGFREEVVDGTASVPSGSFLLTSGTLRSGGSAQVLPMPQKPALVELRLDLGSADYQVYQMVLYDSQSAELMTLSQLKARIEENEINVAFSISSERFTTGDYYISLSGVTETGELEPIARYDFRISRE